MSDSGNSNDSSLFRQFQPLSEDRLQRFLERLPVLYFELNPDGAVLFTNPAVTTATGFRLEDLAGQNWWAVLCPKEKSRTASRIAWQMEKGDVAGEELELVAKNGDSVFLELHSANSYDSDGKLLRIVGMGVDVTARKRSEEAWQAGRYTLERRIEERTAAATRAQTAAEQRAKEADEERRTLQAIMDYIPEGIVIADADVTIRRISAFGVQMCGRQKEFLEDLPLEQHAHTWSIYHLDGKTQASEEELPLTRAIREGRVVTNEEWLIRRPDGRQMVILVNAGPIRDREERITGGVLAWRDITERKQASAERERLLAELEGTINSVAEALIIYGPNGEIRRINPAAQELLHYSPDDSQKPLSERLGRLRIETPDGRPFQMAAILNKVLEGETVRGEVFLFYGPEGSRIWMSGSAAPFRDKEGKIAGVVGTAADITRLHDLQTQREIYIHTISHDLRSPLTLIHGHAQLLQTQEEKDPAIKESVEAILKGTEKVNMMIEDLVDAARLEGGQIDLETAPLDFRTFIEELLERSAMLLETGRIDTDIPEDLPPLAADSERLERILLNLLSNALKYSPPRSRVKVKARREGQFLSISVIDRGEGITPEDLPHIFQKFYRPQGKRRRDSVGLGLYITRMLVEAHGGCIQVESKPGKGSTFTTVLPLA